MLYPYDTTTAVTVVYHHVQMLIFYCKLMNLEIYFTFTNRVDPDDLVLHCLQKASFRGFPNTKG